MADLHGSRAHANSGPKILDFHAFLRKKFVPLRDWRPSGKFILDPLLHRVPLAGLLKISLKAFVVMFQLKVFIKANFEVLHLKDVTIVTNAQCTQLSSKVLPLQDQNQWRIQNFPRGGGANPKDGVKTYYLAKFFPKTAWK